MTLEQIDSLLSSTRSGLEKSGHLPTAEPFPGQLPSPASAPKGASFDEVANALTVPSRQPESGFRDRGMRDQRSGYDKYKGSVPPKYKGELRLSTPREQKDFTDTGVGAGDDALEPAGAARLVPTRR